jgi:hypothetical protein
LPVGKKGTGCCELRFGSDSSVFSDVSEMTGQKIIKATLTGERHPHALAALGGHRAKAQPENLSLSLTSPNLGSTGRPAFQAKWFSQFTD